MTDEKDKQIDRLFDDYASSLKPNERLADNALKKMRDKNSKPKKSRAPVWIGAAAACAAVAIAVFSVMSFFGKGDGLSSSDGNGALAPTAPSDTNTPPAIDNVDGQNSYGINDVRETKVSASFAKDYIDTSVLSDAQITSENYHAYYLKETDEFVYFKAELDISYNGGNIRMSIIAENSAFACKEFLQTYSSVMKGSDYNYSTTNIDGEYVTIAYCKHGGYNYYVSATGNVSGAERIAAEMIGNKN